MLAELYSSTEIAIKSHNVVALVLHKVVDPVRPEPSLYDHPSDRQIDRVTGPVAYQHPSDCWKI